MHRHGQPLSPSRLMSPTEPTGDAKTPNAFTLGFRGASSERVLFPLRLPALTDRAEASLWLTKVRRGTRYSTRCHARQPQRLSRTSTRSRSPKEIFSMSGALKLSSRIFPLLA